MVDKTEQHLAQLSDRLYPLAYEFIATLRANNIPAIITSSTRTRFEQARLVAMGRSRTYKSKHLTGDAFDFDIYGMDRNDIPDWFWSMVGPFGESLGLRWGGRFSTIWDPGHFEI